MKTGENLTNWEVKLIGKRIILQDLKIDDITTDYVDWMNDQSVVKFTESRFQKHTFESTCSYVFQLHKSQDNILFGIFDINNRLHLGNIKIGPIDTYHSIADIGLIVGRKSYWGRGIATETIKLISDYAFEVLKIHKLTASCYENNEGSKKAFLKAGYQQEGIRKKHCRNGVKWVDKYDFGLINPMCDGI